MANDARRLWFDVHVEMHLSVRCKVSGPNGDVEKVSQGCIDTRERASVLTVSASVLLLYTARTKHRPGFLTAITRFRGKAVEMKV